VFTRRFAVAVALIAGVIGISSVLACGGRQGYSDRRTWWLRKEPVKMKKLLLTAAMLCGVTLPAHATSWQCNNFVQNVGYAGRNPPATAVVTHSAGVWFVHYVLQSGMTVDRSTQFNMVDESNAAQTQWSGSLNKDSNKWMRGSVMRRNADGHIMYLEELYDRSNTLLARNTIDCGADTPTRAPSYAPPPAVAQPTVPMDPPQSPSPSYGSTGNSIPFTVVNGGMHVHVTMPGYWADMLVDTGANVSSIGASLSNALLAAGNAVELEGTTVTLAGGSVERRRVISVTSLTIGNHTLNNVPMLVQPDGSEQLLSLSVLDALGKCTIDSANKQLTFG
jgi:Aspartyl protease